MLEFEPEGRLYIGGEFREAATGGHFDVLSPSDESVVGTAADAQAEDVSAAVGAARRAADETSWGSDHLLRQRVLRQLQDALRKEAAAARQIQIAEAGTPVSNIGAHIDVMTEDMTYFNDLIGRFSWETDAGVHQGVGLPSNRRIRYEPYGVVGAITPWNVPFMTDIWKIQHALATGNTVVRYDG
jgi:aldehyde dehydrogenase (NAD+)